MSMFSYISFPRIPDISILEKDPDNVITFKQARGTEIEQRLGIDLSTYPPEMDDTPLIIKDVLERSLGIVISENKDADFTDVFDNKYIYEFSGTLNQKDEETEIKRLKIQNLPTDNIISKIIKTNVKNCKICRNQLMELININLLPGEKIELYSEWVSGLTNNLGPFEREISITADEILTSKCFNSDPDKVKIIIYRNETET